MKAQSLEESLNREPMQRLRADREKVRLALLRRPKMSLEEALAFFKLRQERAQSMSEVR